MEEEFQESEVIFPESVVLASGENDAVERGFSGHLNPRVSGDGKKKMSSVPMNIPENIPGRSWFQFTESDFFDDDDGDGDLVVPPHEMVGRRVCAGKMAFSVCSGNGRTLKGRDLSQVRNSILRMTGFLET